MRLFLRHCRTARSIFECTLVVIFYNRPCWLAYIWAPGRLLTERSSNHVPGACASLWANLQGVGLTHCAHLHQQFQFMCTSDRCKAWRRHRLLRFHNWHPVCFLGADPGTIITMNLSLIQLKKSVKQTRLQRKKKELPQNWDATSLTTRSEWLTHPGVQGGKPKFHKPTKATIHPEHFMLQKSSRTSWLMQAMFRWDPAELYLNGMQLARFWTLRLPTPVGCVCERVSNVGIKCFCSNL